MALLDVFTRLVVAAVLTGFVGLDRELRAKPAGLRTNIVVGTATAAFAYLGAEVLITPDTDPARIAAQVVSGIGFLGGGAIFASGDKPTGLTTAAALWGSAAVGLAAGLAAYGVAFALVVVLVVTLWPVDRFVERRLEPWGRHEQRIQVVVTGLDAIEAVKRELASVPTRTSRIELTTGAERPILDIELRGRAKDVSETVTALHALDAVVAVLHPISDGAPG